MKNFISKKLLQPVKLLLLLCLLLINSFFVARAQHIDSAININDISSYIFIKSIEMGFVPSSFDVKKDFSSFSFSKGLINNGRVTPAHVSKRALVLFRVYNDKDTATECYFFPGFYFTGAQLYRVRGNNITELPNIPPLYKDSVSFRKIMVPANDTMTILAEIVQEKTYNNRVRPRLINSKYLPAYFTELHHGNKEEELLTYLFCGLLLMMILFSLANFSQGGSSEFLYYAGYAFLLGFMLFTKAFYYNRSYGRSFFFESYFDFILQCTGICFYMAFMVRFLETKKTYPFLHKLYTYGITGLIAAMLAYTGFHYGTRGFVIENVIENYITKGLLLAMVVVFLAYAANRWQDKLLRYLFWGNLLYLIFSIGSLTRILVPQLVIIPGVMGNALMMYETGLLLELIFFLAGLTYKNRRQLIEQTRERERLKLENERKELEKQMAVMAAHQEERDRISEDMHDELGSGVTTIRLMSEIAKNKMKENTPSEIEKISASANDLLNKMNAIIWSMNSGNDSVDNLVSYIRAYTFEYMEGTSIHCKVNTPENIPQIDLSGDKRRNIFLCVKETLNNVLKHSRASEMKVDIEVNHLLVIRIADNGTGFDMHAIRKFGNGLKNISRRMERIGGNFRIENENGSVTTLKLPL
jgi:two-component system, NarL family, sensor histidine kinase DesK